MAFEDMEVLDSLEPFADATDADDAADADDGADANDGPPVCHYGTRRDGSCVAVTRLAVGGGHRCALLETKAVYCWGQQSEGQLGLGTSTTPSSPVRIDVGAPVRDVAVGETSTHILTEQGQVFAAGSNQFGALGLPDVGADETVGTFTLVDRPAFKRIFAGWYTTCGLTNLDELQCWGWPMHNAENPSFSPQATPVPLTNVVEAAIGRKAMCAIQGEFQREVLCWGDNERGKVGAKDGTGQPFHTTPISTALAGVRSVSMGEAHGCAVDVEGVPHCWGHNQFGEAGVEPGGNKLAPTPIGPAYWPGPIVEVTTGYASTCYLREDGALFCVGANQGDLAGTGGTQTAVPAELTELKGTHSLRVGLAGACVVRVDGAIVCWGRDFQGQLGGGASNSGGDAEPPRVVALPVDESAAVVYPR